MTGRGKGYRLRGAEVTVCKAFDGAVTVLRDGRELSVRQLAQGGAAVATDLQAAAGPSLAAAVQAGNDRGRSRVSRA